MQSLLTCLLSLEKNGNNLPVQTNWVAVMSGLGRHCLPFGPPRAVETEATQVLLGLKGTGCVFVCVFA